MRMGPTRVQLTVGLWNQEAQTCVRDETSLGASPLVPEIMGDCPIDRPPGLWKPPLPLRWWSRALHPRAGCPRLLHPKG